MFHWSWSGQGAEDSTTQWLECFIRQGWRQRLWLKPRLHLIRLRPAIFGKAWLQWGLLLKDQMQVLVLVLVLILVTENLILCLSGFVDLLAELCIIIHIFGAWRQDAYGSPPPVTPRLIHKISTSCLYKWNSYWGCKNCLHCFDAVGWVTGRASGL